jgi:hypothetical protein
VLNNQFYPNSDQFKIQFLCPNYKTFLFCFSRNFIFFSPKNFFVLNSRDSLEQGCQIFLNIVHIPKREKYSKLHTTIKMAINYYKWHYYIPNCYKIDQYFPFQDPLKFTQIVIFGLKYTIWQPCSRNPPFLVGWWSTFSGTRKAKRHRTTHFFSYSLLFLFLSPQ